MPQVKFQNDSVVENTYTNESDESDISELYTWIRVLKNHQGNFKDSLESGDSELSEDSDVSKYYEYLRNIEINGVSVGSIQREATDFTGDDYFANHQLGDAIDVRPANDTEQKISNKLHSELANRDKRVLQHFEGATVPLTPDKEEMPLYVASNERSEELHTFEEAKEMWNSFLSYIDVVTTGSALNDDADEPEDEPEDNDGDSDQKSVNDPTRIKGVGSATIETLEAGGFEVVPSDVDKIEVEQFGFEQQSEKQEVPEVTSKEVRDRYFEVQDDMVSMEREIVEQRLIDGELMDALSIIEDFE